MPKIVTTIKASHAITGEEIYSGPYGPHFKQLLINLKKQLGFATLRFIVDDNNFTNYSELSDYIRFKENVDIKIIFLSKMPTCLGHLKLERRSLYQPGVFYGNSYIGIFECVPCNNTVQGSICKLCRDKTVYNMFNIMQDDATSIYHYKEMIDIEKCLLGTTRANVDAILDNINSHIKRLTPLMLSIYIKSLETKSLLF
uniref:Uncharacterized protein n=1 Tax=viral metagenome TaxID=1070528 RepID=A0A6C0EIB4_9ZZZZ